VAGIFLGACKSRERVYARMRKGYIKLAMEAGAGEIRSPFTAAWPASWPVHCPFIKRTSYICLTGPHRVPIYNSGLEFHAILTVWLAGTWHPCINWARAACSKVPSVFVMFYLLQVRLPAR
jgi:hypothetical protein